MTALGAFFVVAIVVAGCGSSSSVSSSDVANIAGNPISKQAFNHWMYVAEKGNSVEDGGPVIVPTDPPNFTGCIAQIRAQIPTYKTTAAATLKSDCKELFTNLNAEVLDFLVKAYWYQGTAYKDGIKLTAKQLAAAYNTAAKQAFPTAAEKKEYLTETGQTNADLQFRLRVQTIFQKLLAKQVKKVTPAQIKAYYNSHLSTYGTPATRSIKLIETNSESTIDQAKSAVDSGQSWASVAKKYSTNTATKSTGGTVANVESGQYEAAVNKVIFAAPLNKLEGPIKGTFGYYLVEVTKITPATQQPLSKVSSEIKTTLTNSLDETAETKINAAEKKQWGAQTKCAAAYSMTDCAGYVAPKTTTTAAAATPTTADTATQTVATATSTVTTAGTETATTPSTTTTK